MGLLRKAVKEAGYFKGGVFGQAGSGKTYTSAMLALGISKRLSDGKPVAMFDTETGSDYLIDLFDTEKVELVRVKSQAFSDLLIATKEAEENCSVLLVDSITHVWRELCESYLKQENSRRVAKGRPKIGKLEFQHWGEIKGNDLWGKWTSWFINSKLHVIVCGRAGYEYEFQENDETGKKELIKGDSKMKAEAEFGFEPSLLLEMIRGDRVEVDKVKTSWTHHASVLKDRSRSINGKVFSFHQPGEVYQAGDWKQTFDPFSPVFDYLSIGRRNGHKGIEPHTSEELLQEMNPATPGGVPGKKRAEIALEEIQGSLTAMWPGQDANSKALKMAAIQELFGTRSWAAVEEKPLKELEAAVVVLERMEELKTGDVTVATLPELLLKSKEVDSNN